MCIECLRSIVKCRLRDNELLGEGNSLGSTLVDAYNESISCQNSGHVTRQNASYIIAFFS